MVSSPLWLVLGLVATLEMAQLRLSNAVATDPLGNLYIVDGGNERI